MKPRARIDKLALSNVRKINNLEVFYPIKNIPNFEFENYVVKNDKKGKDFEEEKKKDKNIIKYRRVIKFKHVSTGNVLIISNQRKKKYWAASRLYVIFYPNYFDPITYPDVLGVEQFFRKECGIKLRVSVVHLAVDLVWETQKNRYKRVLRHLRPGNKKPYHPPNKEPYESGDYFGKPYSSNQLLTYDKGRQLREVKDINVTGDIFRTESRLNVPQMNNFIHSINDLAVQDWSSLYPKHFSFHIITFAFKKQLKSIGENWRQPVWQLKELAENELGIWPGNFYRDCLLDHPTFSDPVREVLANYRWCIGFRKYKS